jgi:hypothetical protein
VQLLLVPFDCRDTSGVEQVEIVLDGFEISNPGDLKTALEDTDVLTLVLTLVLRILH